MVSNCDSGENYMGNPCGTFAIALSNGEGCGRDQKGAENLYSSAVYTDLCVVPGSNAFVLDIVFESCDRGSAGKIFSASPFCGANRGGVLEEALSGRHFSGGFFCLFHGNIGFSGSCVYSERSCGFLVKVAREIMLWYK